MFRSVRSLAVAASSSSCAVASSSRRTLSVSVPSLADGHFPEFPKQDLHDLHVRQKAADKATGEVKVHKALPTPKEGERPQVAPPKDASSSPSASPMDPSSSHYASIIHPDPLAPPEKPRPSKSGLLRPAGVTAASLFPSPLSSSSSSSPSSSQALGRTPFNAPQRLEPLSNTSSARGALIGHGAFYPVTRAPIESLVDDTPTLLISIRVSSNNTKANVSWFDRPWLDKAANVKHVLSNATFSGGTLGFKNAASGSPEAGHQVVSAAFRRVEEEAQKQLAARQARMLEKARADRERGRQFEEEELERERAFVEQEQAAVARGERSRPRQWRGQRPPPPNTTFNDDAILQAEEGRAGYVGQLGAYVRVHLNGFGKGREAFATALLSPEGEVMRSMVVALSDHTDVLSVNRRRNHAALLARSLLTAPAPCLPSLAVAATTAFGRGGVSERCCVPRGYKRRKNQSFGGGRGGLGECCNTWASPGEAVSKRSEKDFFPSPLKQAVSSSNMLT